MSSSVHLSPPLEILVPKEMNDVCHEVSQGSRIYRSDRPSLVL